MAWGLWGQERESKSMMGATWDLGQGREETAIFPLKLPYTKHNIISQTVTNVATHHRHQHGLPPKTWRANITTTLSPCLRPWPFCSPALCSWAAALVAFQHTSCITCCCRICCKHLLVLHTGRGSTAGCRSQGAGRGPRSTAAQPAKAASRAQAGGEAAPLG